MSIPLPQNQMTVPMYIIDGEIVVANGDFHAQRHIATVLFLDKGYHHIKIDYFDGGGGAVMDFLWKKPGQTAKQLLVPVEVLFHNRSEE